MPIFVKVKNAVPNARALNDRIARLAQKHSEVFLDVVNAITPGRTTADLADAARASAGRVGLDFSFRSRFSFPEDISVGRNYDIMNAIPNENAVIRDADLVKVAFGSSDANSAFCVQNWTVSVGQTSAPNAKLMAAAKVCLDRAIGVCRPGALVSSVANALHETARAEGIFMSTVFTGHMIGAEPILPPMVQGPRGLLGEDFALVEGCMLSLLALAHPAKPVERQREDKWTLIDKNRYPSAVFSHMVLVTDGAPRILTSDYPTHCSA